ncbi:MAG: serine/threonine protein kinase with repeat [Chthoniobacteraceae bacterium]|nr:serine/threonine protein kinase with repeat [Chthoniobacteraceae bacterium]
MNDSTDREVVVFTEASQLPADERVAYLERACGGEAKLRQRVEALLLTYDHAGDFLEQSAPGGAHEFRQAASVAEKPGDRIGHCKLLRQIGEGGCGVVYMADQEEPVRRRVALKIIKPGMDTKNVIARFEAERQTLALMDHPNIARIFDAGATESGRPYFVMQLVDGVKITEFCDQNSLSTEERLNLFVEVCQAVQHAHQKGIIHRDIKPSNILVTRTLEGRALPVVIDFGIAKPATNQLLAGKTVFTAFEMLIGTPAYMSPEQAELASVDVDTRSDIYSLGVLLYELLTGSTPFNTVELMESGLDEVRRVIREQIPVLPSTRIIGLLKEDLTSIAHRRKAEPPQLIRAVCGDLDWIAMKALEKDRTRRYETANALALDVQRFLANETVTARPPSAVYRFQKSVSRNKLLFGGIGIVAILLFASLAIVTASYNREREARKKAETEEARSRQTTQFLKDLLEGVGPSVARGQDSPTMLKGILDIAAQRIGNEMTGQPSVEAELRGQIGRLYLEIGNYNEAEKMHRRALAIYRSLFGQDSQQAATELNDLGLALWRARKLDESAAVLREALGIRRLLFGNVHAEVAATLNNLAGVFRRQRKLAEAEALTRESLEIRRKLFGSEHLDVADSLRNLSILLGDEGRRVESETIAREVLAMRRRLVGNEHPLVAAALVDVGWAAGYNGKLDEAESMEQEALALQRKVLGDDHPDVAKSFSSLGQRMQQQGKFAEAHGVLGAAVSIQRKLLGQEDPATLDSLRSLGSTLEREGKLDEAGAAFRESLISWRKRLDDGDPKVFDGFENLTRVLLAQKHFAEVEKLLNEALTPEFASQPSSSKLLVLRADLLGRRGRWKEAAKDAALLIQHQPEEHYRYQTLIPLLAITGDRQAYEQLCRQIVAVFPTTKNRYVAERMARNCLLLPRSGIDLRWTEEFADVALAPESGEPANPFNQGCKALSKYRQGRLQEAIDWAEKAVNSSDKYASAQACAVLAMAHWQLGHESEARAHLAKGETLVPDFKPVRDDEEIGGAWVAWLLTRVSLQEAAALIQSGSKGNEDSVKPLRSH